MTFIDDARLRAIGPDRYAATLAPAWSSMVGIHGGYVASVATQAILMAVGHDGRSLRSLDVEFVRPPTAGEITIDLDVVNAGRSITFARAILHQDDRPVVIASSVTGHPREGPEFDEVPRPALAGRAIPQDAERVVGGSGPSQHLEQLELRLEPGLTLLGGTGIARVAGWMRPLDSGEPVTIPWLICAADFMPPSMLFRSKRAMMAASVGLTVHVLCRDPSVAVSPSEFVYGEMRSWFAADGFCIEDGRFWSQAGQLLATSRQLRLAGT